MLNLAKSVIFVGFLLYVSSSFVEPFCFHGSGGIGEYSAKCMSSDTVEYEACYARCNCWSNFPDIDGEKIGEVDALCLFDKCYCDYDLVSM